LAKGRESPRSPNRIQGEILVFLERFQWGRSDPASGKIRVDKSKGACQDLQGSQKNTETNEAKREEKGFVAAFDLSRK